MAKNNEVPNEETLQFIRLVVGPQLKNHGTKRIVAADIEFMVDYCILRQNPDDEEKIILLLPGFGSGWTGIAKLGYDLCSMGHVVCMVSLPGYGNSSDPPRIYSESFSFEWEAYLLNNFIEKVLSRRKVHLIGHSLGAAIIAHLAFENFNHVASLTLLNPAGFEKRGKLELTVKFAANGIEHGFAFRGDPVWKELRKYLPKEKSPFARNRLLQRYHEWGQLCRGKMTNMLKSVLGHVPVCSIWGEKDYVYPMEKSSIFSIDEEQYDRLRKVSLPLWHNTTMFGSKMTATAIDKFISVC